MRDSSLIELLRTFSAKESKEFLIFLRSDYLANGKYKAESVVLFGALSKFAPHFDDSKLEKEKVFDVVFPKEAYSEGKLEKVMVGLLKLLKLFLLTEKYFSETNDLNVQVDFASILFERQLHRKATNLIQNIETEIQKKTPFSVHDYSNLYRISGLAREMASEKNTWKKDLNIKETLRFLDLYFLSSRLPLLNHYLLLRTVSKVEIGLEMEKEMELIQLANVQLEESPTIYILQKIFELYLKSPDIEAAEIFYQLLKENEHKLDVSDLKDFWSYLRSYISLLINTNDANFLPFLHKIQTENLEAGYFYTNNLIPPGRFFNLVLGAVRAKKNEWAFNFLESHKFLILGDNESNDYYRMAKAYLLFHVKKMEEALDFIPAASPNLDFHNLARRLELMIYYEQKADLLSYKIDAFKMYLSRSHHKTMSDENYETNNNFLNILIQLMQSKPSEVGRRAVILRRIEEKKRITVKEWLIEKANELR
jgi:hypothetical protein